MERITILKSNTKKTLDKNILVNESNSQGEAIGVSLKSNSSNSAFESSNKNIIVNSIPLPIPKPEKNERGLDNIADAHYPNIPPVYYPAESNKDDISIVGVGALLGYINNDDHPYFKNKLNTTDPNETEDEDGNTYIYI